jgi:hypothetical protein
MIFGWALLNETRPSKFFWSLLKFWTTCVLFLKFFANIKYGNSILKNNSGYVKLGLFSYDDLGSIVAYILPEICILCLLMVN